MISLAKNKTYALLLLVISMMFQAMVAPLAKLSLIKHSSLRKLLSMGLFLSIQSLFFFEALEHIPVSAAILILYLNPVTIALLAYLFLGRKFNRTFVISLFLVVIGSAFIFIDAFARNLSGIGLSLAIAAMIITSVFGIFLENTVNEEEPLSVIFYVLLFASVSLSLFSSPITLLNLNQYQLFLVMSMGVFSTAISGVCWYMAVREVGITYAALFSSFEPVVALTITYLVLQETLVAYQLVGSALIIVGVILPDLMALYEKRVAN